MKESELIRLRLTNQRLAKPVFKTPAEVVSWLGAMQAQDFLGALWSVGQRIEKCTENDIEQAIADRSIVRTWPMRGTLHFVPPENVRWMLGLLAPRVLAKAQGIYRQEGLDKTAFSKSRKVVEKILGEKGALTRDQLYDALRKAKISPDGQRGLHLINNAAMHALICLGPRAGKQQTFVLLDEWIPGEQGFNKDEALEKIARIYFTSHGPATLHDFAWWTGLTLTEGRRAIDMVGDDLTSVVIEQQTYWMGKSVLRTQLRSPHVALLSWFDEYIISYKDRSAAFDPATKKFIQNPKNGIYTAVILVDGKIAGNWKRTFMKNKVDVEMKPFRPFTAKEKSEVEKAVNRYKKFVERSLTEE